MIPQVCLKTGSEFGLKNPGNEFIQKIPGRDVNAWMETLRPAIKQYANLLANGVMFLGGNSQKQTVFLYTIKESTKGKQVPSMSLFVRDFHLPGRSNQYESAENLDRVRAPTIFTESLRQQASANFKYVLNQLLGVKDKGKFGSCWGSKTEKENEFMKNVLEKCENEIEKNLESDERYQKALKAKLKADLKTKEEEKAKQEKAHQEIEATFLDIKERFERGNKAREENALREEIERQEFEREHRKSCVGSLVKTQPDLHAEFLTKIEENVKWGQTLEASCQRGYSTLGHGAVADLKFTCMGGIWVSEGRIQCLESGSPFMATIVVWIFIAAFN